MIALWFAIVAVAVAVYVALDGYDFGAAIVSPFVAHTEAERRDLMDAIGPLWTGNEVWLIAAGGTLLGAFPAAFAAGFSGLYLPLIFLLWLFVLRGLAMELRAHVDHPLWRVFWDRLLIGVSLLIAVLFGAALGTVLRGVPLDRSGFFFFLNLFGGPGSGVLNGYTVFVGAVAAVLLAQHGAQFLAWRATGQVGARSAALARKLSPLSLGFLIVSAVVTVHVQPALLTAVVERPLVWALGAAALSAMAVCAVGNWKRAPGLAFAGSASTLVLVLAAGATAEFPVLLRSTLGPEFNLEAAASASGPTSLAAASLWWPVGLVLAVGYTAVLLRTFRKQRIAAQQ